jgi:NAD(P)-dependent dehydrogenase (short-subunit alcohol dehydrogenase family)
MTWIRLILGADDRVEAMDLFDLSGRVALVTGGNGGIGFGMAEGLDQSKSQTAVATLRERGGTAEAVMMLPRKLPAARWWQQQ